MAGIVCRAYARTGLLGNPSDQFEGKTIALSLANFYAEVKIVQSEELVFIPHEIHDATRFDSLDALSKNVNTYGYHGGIRLLKAMCNQFHKYCLSNDIHIEGKQFSISYMTTIPRQLGLAGSSAIVTAALSCLLEFFGVGSAVPVSHRPGLILAAENELGITAGLQDRVIQVYGGCVFMDFAKHHIAKFKHGLCCSIPIDGLPELYLILSQSPSESGKVHSGVKDRWLKGDKTVVDAMQEIAELAEKGREALSRIDCALLGSLMDKNFDLRRRVYGDEVVGSSTVGMVELARRVGANANTTGSGGAVVVHCPDGDPQVKELKRLCDDAGYVLVKVEVGKENFPPPHA